MLCSYLLLLQIMTVYKTRGGGGRIKLTGDYRGEFWKGPLEGTSSFNGCGSR